MHLDVIYSCSSDAGKKFALSLKPSTDTVLQSADLCVLKMLNYLYEIFHIFKDLLLHNKRWRSIKSLWLEFSATEVEKYKAVGSCHSCALGGGMSVWFGSGCYSTHCFPS